MNHTYQSTMRHIKTLINIAKRHGESHITIYENEYNRLYCFVITYHPTLIRQGYQVFGNADKKGEYVTIYWSTNNE